MRRLICVSMLVWLITVGCSQAARERFKYWFFDVAKEATAESDSRAVTTHPDFQPWPAQMSLQVPSLPGSRYASLHPPFVLRQCLECHDAAQRMQARVDLLDSCSSCHSRYFSDEVGHAPVAEGLCSECHEMHQSDKRYLLKMSTFDLCIECHDEPEDLTEPAHSGPDVQRCTACHDPHFGTGVLLRPDSSIAIPG